MITWSLIKLFIRFRQLKPLSHTVIEEHWVNPINESFKSLGIFSFQTSLQFIIPQTSKKSLPRLRILLSNHTNYYTRNNNMNIKNQFIPQKITYSKHQNKMNPWKVEKTWNKNMTSRDTRSHMWYAWLIKFNHTAGIRSTITSENIKPRQRSIMQTSESSYQ